MELNLDTKNKTINRFNTIKNVEEYMNLEKVSEQQLEDLV